MQVLIIDALNLIRRIYAAQERPFLPLTNEVSDATRKQIVHNTVAAVEVALKKMLVTVQPSHGIVVFEAVIIAIHKKGPRYIPGKWSSDWQLPFNTKKCKCLHIGNGNSGLT